MIKLKNIKDLVNLVGKKIKHKDSDYPYTIMSFITTMKGNEKHYYIYTNEHYFSGSELEIYSRLLNYEVLE